VTKNAVELKIWDVLQWVQADLSCWMSRRRMALSAGIKAAVGVLGRKSGHAVATPRDSGQTRQAAGRDKWKGRREMTPRSWVGLWQADSYSALERAWIFISLLRLPAQDLNRAGIVRHLGASAGVFDPEDWDRRVFEVSVIFYQITRRHILDGRAIHNHYIQNLRLPWFCSLLFSGYSKKLNSVPLVREWTTPTERPALVGEVIANVCGWRMSRGQRNGSLRPYS
jgi:hypothetical protein